MCLQMFPDSCSNKMNLLSLNDNIGLLHAVQCHILGFTDFPGGGCCVGTSGTSCGLQSGRAGQGPSPKRIHLESALIILIR